MKIITLHQPYASLIALGLKQYETRSWATKYQGKLAIHAAKRPFVSEDGTIRLNKIAFSAWIKALELAYKSGLINDQSRLPLSHQLPLGCVVAIADLTDCMKMNPDYDFRQAPGFISLDTPSLLEKAVGNWQSANYAWKLENIVALSSPIPYIGAQGLRFADEELNQRIQESIA